ncbi:MAG: hypothetical protein J0I07_01730 [Myxococcales bacterium]|nr:hypothetical protein [Myxococcales bacterium]
MTTGDAVSVGFGAGGRAAVFAVDADGATLRAVTAVTGGDAVVAVDAGAWVVAVAVTVAEGVVGSVGVGSGSGSGSDVVATDGAGSAVTTAGEADTLEPFDAGGFALATNTMSPTPVSASAQNAASAPQSARGRALVVADVVVAAIVVAGVYLWLRRTGRPVTTPADRLTV